MNINFTWEEFDKASTNLASKLEQFTRTGLIKGIYGIPRGGLILAVTLSHRLGLPLVLNYDKYPSHELIVVDDISDSGKTLALLNPILSTTIHIVRETKFMPTLFYAEKKKSDWIIYPWEKK